MMEDERGRVPFAVVAILLLVGSATVATTMTPAEPPDEPTVDVVVDRVEAEQQTALRRAVSEAANDAGSAPVVEPANTTVGRALGNESTFRRSLRLRVYVAVRDQFETIERRRGETVARTTLPPIDAENASAVRRAIDRVDLRAADDNATAITVGIENVTTTVQRGNRTLVDRTDRLAVTVATPILGLHQRVSAYEERLNAGVTRPGLEQRLAAIMNAAGWARGYAQYSGGPIDNVISNRHVELATNAAVLDVQRSTIGRMDPGAMRGFGEALAKASAQELLAMRSQSSPFLQQALDQHSVVQANEIAGFDPAGPDDTMSVGVNRTATDVFLFMARDGGQEDPARYVFDESVRLDTILDETYSADARLEGTVTGRSGGPPEPISPDGSGWTRVSDDLDRETRVIDAGTAESGATGGDWHTFDRFTRRVVTEYDRTTTWERAGQRERTHTSGEETTTVSIAVLGRHAADLPGPEGRIHGVHEAGSGALGGPNLAGIESAAIDRLVADRGGRDELVRAAANDDLDEGTVTISGERPDELREWVYRDLRNLREEVRDVSVEVERGAVGSFSTNPPGRLAAKLAEQRAALLASEPPYDGTADRARVAARAQYLELVTTHLERRASDRGERRNELGNALDDAGGGGVEDLERSLEASVDGGEPRQPGLTGPGGPVRIRVDAAPSYLTLSEVSEDTLPAVDGETYPLVARNENLFSLPYGEAINGLIDGFLSGPERVRLGAAARTLHSSESVDGPTSVTLGGIETDFRSIVGEKIENVENEVQSTLAEREVGEDAATRRAVVDDALASWDGTDDRAIAISNGSAADAIVATADDRTELSVAERDRLRLELDRQIRTVLEESQSQPRAASVDALHSAAKSELSGAVWDVATEYQDRTVSEITNDSLSTLPSGLPLAPLPGYWYATTNVWHIEVEGEYARFGVRATRGRPTDPGAGMMYARDGGNVTLDVDGSEKQLGSARRVQFSATVDVVVVVPPGAQGVGDVGGERNERSAGWETRGE